MEDRTHFQDFGQLFSPLPSHDRSLDHLFDLSVNNGDWDPFDYDPGYFERTNFCALDLLSPDASRPQDGAADFQPMCLSPAHDIDREAINLSPMAEVIVESPQSSRHSEYPQSVRAHICSPSKPSCADRKPDYSRTLRLVATASGDCKT